MDWPLFFAGMTETWRTGRKLLDRSLRQGEMTSYRQMMQEKTQEFLAQLHANPKDFYASVELSVLAIFLLLYPMNGNAGFRENSSCHSRMAMT